MNPSDLQSSRPKTKERCTPTFGKKKQKADSLKYQIEKEAESNLNKFSPKYLEYIKVKSFSNNLVIVHGDSVPGYIMNP